MLAIAHADKPLLWLHGEVKTPPFSAEASRPACCYAGCSVASAATTPTTVIAVSRTRLRHYDDAVKG